MIEQRSVNELIKSDHNKVLPCKCALLMRQLLVYTDFTFDVKEWLDMNYPFLFIQF